MMKRLSLAPLYVLFTATCLCVLVSSEARAQHLQLGDGVRLTFYNIDDNVSGDYFILQDGTLQLPYIGLIEADTSPFEYVQASIIRSYQSIYRQPELTVQPLFRVNVLGEVQTPGIYYVTGYERLTDLLAMAGGETLDADLDKIFLIRDNDQIDINAKSILKEGTALQDIGLESGDQIYVSREGLVSYRNASLIISGLGVLVTLAAIFIVRN